MKLKSIKNKLRQNFPIEAKKSLKISTFELSSIERLFRKCGNIVSPKKHKKGLVIITQPSKEIDNMFTKFIKY